MSNFFAITGCQRLLNTLFSAMFSFLICLTAYAADAEEDTAAPRIEHKPALGDKFEGDGIVISARVTDNVGIDTVVLYYRTIGSDEYAQMPMTSLDHSGDFEAILQPDSLSQPGVEYFIQATDVSGNVFLEGYIFSPLQIAIVPVGSDRYGPLHASLPDEQSKAGNTPDIATAIKKSSRKKTWLWVGAGVVLAAVIASSAGGGSSDSDSSGAVVFEVDAP